MGNNELTKAAKELSYIQPKKIELNKENNYEH